MGEFHVLSVTLSHPGLRSGLGTHCVEQVVNVQLGGEAKMGKDLGSLNRIFSIPMFHVLGFRLELLSDKSFAAK